MSHIGPRATIAFSLLSLLTSAALADESPKPSIEYNRDVRPILSEHCFACHGPDSASRKADLRLDRREAAIEAEVILPGNAEESELVRRIFSTERDEVMPPPKSKKELKPEQKEILKRWVASGAEYQPHWSLIAPKRPVPPAVKDEGWIRNPIDRFILAKLEERGLKPAPEADRYTLARRLSLDLTGLPPEPSLVDAFVNDTAPDAYEKLIDKLQSSIQWGEHRGRHWLDAARYADTHGIHIDNYREMWTFRDWVINAFNRNVPFDQFTIEQLAGDLLPNRTLEQQIASGFNRCNITTNEGGAIAEEYLVLYNRDRTETTSQVWLGLTAGCAVCHDHKFDPISQKEFYSLAAFFNNTTQKAMDGNIKDTPPIVFVPAASDEERWNAIGTLVAEAKQKVEGRKKTARADFEQWLTSAASDKPTVNVPSEGLAYHAPLNDFPRSAKAALDGISLAVDLSVKPGHVAAQAFQVKPGLTLEAPDAGDFEKTQGFSYGAWVQMPPNDTNAAILARMDDQHDYRGWDLWYQNGQIAADIIHKWPGDALKVVSKSRVKRGEWTHVFVTYDGSGKPPGLSIYINGQKQETTIEARDLKNSTRTKVPLKVAQRHTGSRLDEMVIQDIRIYSRTLPPVEVEQLVRSTRAAWLVNKPVEQRTPADKDDLFAWWLPTIDEPYQKLIARRAELVQEESAIRARGTVAHVMNEKGEMPSAFVLFRGDYDKRRDQVTPQTPAALPPMPPDLPKNRLGLAQWLLRPEHPLTARVTVNRFWQELFGTGLVRTAGDFGVTGELPSHPELLDWLAIEFREGGWDVKKLFRLLVTSATYRQSAAATPDKLEKDGQNRLLSRGPRFRMDAEMIRDYALAASGLLNEKIGGPSVKPYQPEGVWEAVAMIGSNTRNYRPDSGDKLYRRSLYTFWKRSAPPASMEIFNAPSREVCTVRRERTDTPLQALVTMNDPQFVEAARSLAERVLKDGGPSAETRLDFLARKILTRPLCCEEGSIVAASLDDLLAYYQDHPEDARQLIAVGDSKPDPALDASPLAAWTMLANEMFNLDEVLNK
jgi:hypothetical protein